MPWKIFRDGDKYCVHKLHPDKSKGPLVKGGCHATKEKAMRHKGALYHSEQMKGSEKLAPK